MLTGWQYLDRVTCPILFVGGERDTLAPLDDIILAFQKCDNASLIVRDCGHFDVDRDEGGHWSEVSEATCRFITESFLLKSCR